MCLYVTNRNSCTVFHVTVEINILASLGLPASQMRVNCVYHRCTWDALQQPNCQMLVSTFHTMRAREHTYTRARETNSLFKGIRSTSRINAFIHTQQTARHKSETKISETGLTASVLKKKKIQFQTHKQLESKISVLSERLYFWVPSQRF